jgi:hypothetical protein
MTSPVMGKAGRRVRLKVKMVQFLKSCLIQEWLQIICLDLNTNAYGHLRPIYINGGANHGKIS